jgi:hypothetical protein
MRFNKRLFNLALLSCFSLLFWGCIEYTITTQVMPDGRILRTVTFKGDSASIFRGSFRMPSDSTWAISTRYEQQRDKDSVNGKVFVYEATKEFPDYQALNSCFYRDSAFSNKIIIRVTLTRKWKWFYAHNEYTETYSRIFPFRSVPIRDFMTHSELRIYLAEDDEVYYSREKDSLMMVTDSLSLLVLSAADTLRSKQLHDNLEHRFELWQKINIYNDLYCVVIKALDKMGKSADTAKTKGPFYQWLDSTRVFESVKENSDAFTKAAATFFRVDASALEAANRDGFDTFTKKFRISDLTLETYTSQVLMPGMIVHANSKDIKGNLVTWHFKVSDFYASDYTMVVHSRHVNKPAIVIAAILLVMLVGFALFRMFRK